MIQNKGPIKMAVSKRKLLSVVLDGIGIQESTFGNAVALARTPNMNWLKTNGLYTTIRAHGKAVGLPSDNDIGNSEVGHNALGAGNVYDQGAKLVNNAIKNGTLFSGQTWKDAIAPVKANQKTLHFLGLLSDGNVHSHQDHLFAMLIQAEKEGVKKIRIHVLLDGRDVPAKSAEIYVDKLNSEIKKLQEKGCDIEVGSGGGRMTITMDRYGANWEIVENGWKTHVLGEGPRFPSLSAALSEYRGAEELTDQYIPGFVIEKSGSPVGKIVDGDSVLLFNFRGDRAIEISQAFSDQEFPHFDRKSFPKVYFAGMMEYDGDKHIPNNYLVSPPLIENTMGEKLAHSGVNQFACSETQKFGHVTFFWNGNRSGYFDEKIENYIEIPSDNIRFELKPAMKAYEITEATINEMSSDRFEFGRINFANGDMVGHTGDLESTIIAVSTVDLMLGRLISHAKKTDTILIVTADHGNADQMFEGKESDYPNWETLSINERPRGKTSHTLAEVPFYVFDPKGEKSMALEKPSVGTLANFANTAFDLMGLGQDSDFEPSLLTSN